MSPVTTDSACQSAPLSVVYSQPVSVLPLSGTVAKPSVKPPCGRATTLKLYGAPGAVAGSDTSTASLGSPVPCVFTPRTRMRYTPPGPKGKPRLSTLRSARNGPSPVVVVSRQVSPSSDEYWYPMIALLPGLDAVKSTRNPLVAAELVGLAVTEVGAVGAPGVGRPTLKVCESRPRPAALNA